MYKYGDEERRYTLWCFTGVHSEGQENRANAFPPTPATQNSPPCCCRVRRSPQAWVGPAAGSLSPGVLRGRPQPIDAEQPGEKTGEMTQVEPGPA